MSRRSGRRRIRRACPPAVWYCASCALTPAFSLGQRLRKPVAKSCVFGFEADAHAQVSGHAVRTDRAHYHAAPEQSLEIARAVFHIDADEISRRRNEIEAELRQAG